MPATEPVSQFARVALGAEETARIRADMAACLVKRKLNALDKRKEWSRALEMVCSSEERLMQNVIAFSDRPWAERVACQRAWWSAHVEWLQGNPGDDLDPERAAFLRKLAGEELMRAESLAIALSEVEAIEEGYSTEEPSRTHVRLKEKLKLSLEDVGGYLSSSITAEQVGFVKGLWSNHGRTFRWRRRWRLERKSWGDDGARASLLDARVASCSFSTCIDHADTQRDVRELLAIWGESSEIVRDDQGTRFVGRGFTIFAA